MEQGMKRDWRKKLNEKVTEQNRTEKKEKKERGAGSTQPLRNLPKTMANVFVALRSFFADDFSRFFFDALCTLYMVNLEGNH